MNEQLQAAFDKKFKDTWFFEDVPLNHATPATTGRTITAVSYTHLDVYKRQGYR